MSTAQTKLWWRRNSAQQSLATEVDSLIERVGADQITWSYLEWRPGSNLCDDPTAPILAQGAPNHNQSIPLDEVRLFTADGGIHAIEDSGRTRWMQWQTRLPENANDNAGWISEQVHAEEWDKIFMLSNEAARRFGLNKGALPRQEKMKIIEYRRNGELFCWNLTEGVGT